MSRLGKLPIELGEGTQARIEDGFIIVKGKKGELKEKFHDSVNIEINDKEIKVSVKDPANKDERALWGLFRSLIKNMAQGVEEGFEKKLEINGVGDKAELKGETLVLYVGYSNPVEYKIPQDVTASVEKNIITLESINKQLLGETAASIRKIRKPEPYKGKGIKYVDEIILRKAGKQVKTGGD